MHHFFTIIVISCCLVWLACNEDRTEVTAGRPELLEATLSGQVKLGEIVGEDTVVNDVLAGAVILYGDIDAIARYQDGDDAAEVLTVTTDANGSFLFESMRPDSGKWLTIAAASLSGYTLIRAEDETPDPDGTNGDPSAGLIDVELDKDEMDADNNFTVIF